MNCHGEHPGDHARSLVVRTQGSARAGPGQLVQEWLGRSRHLECGAGPSLDLCTVWGCVLAPGPVSTANEQEMESGHPTLLPREAVVSTGSVGEQVWEDIHGSQGLSPFPAYEAAWLSASQ